MKARNGSILVALLWSLALLSLVVIGVLHTARMDLMAVKNHGDKIQAHYLALAGIEKAKALIFQDSATRSKSGQNHSGHLYDSPSDFRDIRFSRGQFRVLRDGSPDENAVVYGIADLDGRLNLNKAELGELGKIYGMVPELVSAIIDWRDRDNAASAGGAGAAYYSSLVPPYRPRNGSYESVEELLMVRGVTHQMLYGDRYRGAKGLSQASDANSPNPGWASLLTTHSTVRNVNASGVARINVQTDSESTLQTVKGITPEIAKAIVASRGQNEIKNLADLLEVSMTSQPRSSRGTPASGPKAISETLLQEIADDITTESDTELEGMVNVNTAPLEVLICLPGLSRELAQALIAHRKSNGYFQNNAQLLKVPGMNREIFKQLSARAGVRSENFHIRSEGMVGVTKARKKIEMIVRLGRYDFETLFYREDL